jgi:hypothetical protein
VHQRSPENVCELPSAPFTRNEILAAIPKSPVPPAFREKRRARSRLGDLATGGITIRGVPQMVLEKAIMAWKVHVRNETACPVGGCRIWDHKLMVFASNPDVSECVFNGQLRLIRTDSESPLCDHPSQESNRPWERWYYRSHNFTCHRCTVKLSDGARIETVTSHLRAGLNETEKRSLAK